MKNKTLLTQWLPIPFRHYTSFFAQQILTQLAYWRARFTSWLDVYWFRLIVLALAAFLALQKDVSIQLTWQNPIFSQQSDSPPNPQQTQQLGTWVSQKSSNNENHPLTEKQKTQMAYVERFGKVAQEEMKKYGIPASITLAQGILETNAGHSPLATKNNNHFGMKCFSKKCKKGHCSNFSDDTHKDFFVKYNTAWDSFRAHSQLLTNKRYQPLFQLDQKDYKAWARGLKKAGYATDKLYAKKLIHLIEDLNLERWDG